jgi:GT2 family glycosyltransferase
MLSIYYGLEDRHSELQKIERLMNQKTYVIIVNWNGWIDTIECLETVLRSDYSHFQVILCDNGSRDGSLAKIKEWAEGRLIPEIPFNHPLRFLSSPPVAKPISYIEYSTAEAASGGYDSNNNSKLILIRIESNLGFAGGNNVGIRYALARNDFNYIWLLNNDTVIMPDALSCLVRRIEQKRGAGMCGSTLPYYHQNETIWTLGGGTYNKWLGISCNIDNQSGLNIEAVSQQQVEEKLIYLAGASILVSRAFLKDVGPMCEDYFLFFEEPDWILRGKGKYCVAYAKHSIVYHKVGSSTSLHDKDKRNGMPSLYYILKNRILFTKKFFPLALPSVICFTLYTQLVVKRMRNSSNNLFKKVSH